MARPSGIPRLQEVEFLTDAMLALCDGATFDQVRLGLIDAMEARRSREPQTGNHAGARRRPADDTYGYLHNAAEAVAELIRLGYLERQPVPTTRAALDQHRARVFAATPDGERWAALLRENRPREAYDELFARLWAQHPQFSGFLRILARGRFIVPTAQWTEAVERFDQGDAAVQRDTYIAFLADRCVRAMGTESLGWTATREDIAAAVRDYVSDRLSSAERRGRPDPYPRGRDFAGACEEALVKFAFARAGLAMDFISLEILRRWCRSLGLAGFTYHVPGRPALVLWSTADITETRSGVSVRRHTDESYATAVVQSLPEAFAEARRFDRTDFVAIYLVRAWSCSTIGVSDLVFDRALTAFLDNPDSFDLGFRVHLDPAQYRPVPPTERPFRSGSRHLYSMTLVPAKNRSAA